MTIQTEQERERRETAPTLAYATAGPSANFTDPARRRRRRPSRPFSTPLLPGLTCSAISAATAADCKPTCAAAAKNGRWESSGCCSSSCCCRPTLLLPRVGGSSSSWDGCAAAAAAAAAAWIGWSLRRRQQQGRQDFGRRRTVSLVVSQLERTTRVKETFSVKNCL
jgi:hypothetical protein